MVAPFPSVVFHRLLGTCSFFKITLVFVCFEKVFVCFMITLVSVLKSVIKRFFKRVLKVWCKNELNLSKYLRTIYLLEKGRSFPPFL